MFKTQGFFRITAATLALCSSLSVSRAQLFVTDQNNGTVGEYTTSGQTNTNALINLSFPSGIAVSGNTLFVASASGTIGSYTTAGLTNNSALVSGLSFPELGVAVSGTNLYVATAGDGNLGSYSTSGATINATFITGLSEPLGQIAVSGTNLYVIDYGNNRISLYSTSGTALNLNFITGLNEPLGLTLWGTNIYVANAGANTIGLYSTSGTVLNTALISSGLNEPSGITTDGTNLYVANFNGGTVGAYTLAGATVNTSLIKGFSAPYGIVWQSTAPTPPVLNIALAGGNVVLSWPATNAVFRVLQNTDLTTSNWVAITNLAGVTNGQNQVALPPAATPGAFFELVNP